MFTLPGGESVEGRLILDPQYDYSVILRVINPPDQWSNPSKLKKSLIHGQLNNGMYLTLIGSISTKSIYTQSIPYDDFYCDSLFTAHTYDISHLKCHSVNKIRFKLPHSRKIFPVYINQVSSENRQEILKTIMGDTYQSNDLNNSFERVYYCGGVSEIISCNTKYGQVKVRPYQVSTLPYIDVEFEISPNFASNSFSNAEEVVECIIRFLWLLTGSRQYAEKIQIQMKDPDDGRSINVDAHFLLQEEPLFTANTKQQYPEILIDPIHDHTMFEKCLTAWSNLNEQRRTACDVILSQFNEPTHSPFRIARSVAAFEWFFDPHNEMDGDDQSVAKITEIMDFAQNHIKKQYAKSKSRGYVLSKLTINPKKPKQKDKINSRLSIIQDHLPEELKKIINKLLKQAVDARNEYIHDHSYMFSELDYHHYIHMADTLEFIFLSSVLVECGWDMKSWLTTAHTLSHPFSRYIAQYTPAYSS